MQDVSGRFQSENWTEHASTGHSYALIKHRKMHRKAENVAKITLLHKDHTLLTLLFNIKISLCLSYVANIRPSNYGEIFEKCMKPREQFQIT